MPGWRELDASDLRLDDPTDVNDNSSSDGSARAGKTEPTPASNAGQGAGAPPVGDAGPERRSGRAAGEATCNRGREAPRAPVGRRRPAGLPRQRSVAGSPDPLRVRRG